MLLWILKICFRQNKYWDFRNRVREFKCSSHDYFLIYVILSTNQIFKFNIKPVYICLCKLYFNNRIETERFKMYYTNVNCVFFNYLRTKKMVKVFTLLKKEKNL